MINSEVGPHDGDPSMSYLAPETDQDDASSLFSTDSGYLMDLADASDDSETILPKTDFHSPYFVNVPTPSQLGPEGSESGQDLTTGYVREYPTDILLDRFSKWRKILKGLANYLREVAYAQERFARINYGLRSNVKFSFLTDLEESTNRIIDPFQQRAKKPGQAQPSPGLLRNLEDDIAGSNASTSSLQPSDLKPNMPMAPGDNASASSGFMKFGSGSIEDIQVILKKYHSSMGNQQIKMSKEISTVVVPKLDDLRKDLQLKIKEIKDLHNDFRTNIGEHIALTGQLLQKYMAAVKFMSTNTDEQNLLKFKGQKLKPKHDPYLLKLQLDLQLKRQLLEENYLQEAFINLQSSGMELEKIIYGEIQHTLQRYSALVSTSARVSISNLCNELHQGILSKPPATEWDHFVGHHPKCMIDWKSTEPIPQPRKLSDIRYPRMKSSLAKCIKAGYLLKKSQILKNYNKGYFVLTSNYLHEFKSSNFFKLSQETSEKKDHGEVQTGSKKRGMVPVMSLHLNSAQVVEVTEHKFCIRGVTSSSNFDKKSAETSKIISKSTSSIQKFLKSTAKTPGHKKDHGIRHTSLSGPSGGGPLPKEKEKESSDDVATWVFKVAGSGHSAEDSKELKKWVSEVKHLSSFNNSADRAKFIEEKIFRAHNRASSVNLLKMGADAKKFEKPSSIKAPGSRGKPQYIHLGAQDFAASALARAKINTPSIDDNGNLITAGEGRTPSVKSLSELSSPRMSPSPSNTPGTGGQSALSPTKQGYVITSNGITPISRTPGQTPGSNHATPGQTPGSNHATPVNRTPVQTPKRTPGLAASGASSDGSGNQVLNSPSSHVSGSSGGGYFAIPVAPTSQGSTPGLDPAAEHAAAAQGQNQAPVVPMVRLNDREFSNERLDKSNINEQSSDRTNANQRMAEGGQINRGAPVHNLRKNLSTGNMGAIINEPPSNVYSSPKAGNSSQSLLAGNAQQMRKHKKNVSFSSLNSLLFSKKGGDVSNNNMTDYFMSGNRIEENDDADAFNVNQSLYRDRNRSP
ncbi:LANO_0F09604g1_1 [Lachancea nothofagi CBS 11611]|uniref:LANO_0F09604g1_1 n=1 Tax=Lachancea nothofagi CBS 11611 TaxID=1266666 RepID=A0A1G4KA25_9SACH|nr:LANO_0F09604g1_1 [Lachancea nothofagi CBS 11611]